MVFYFQEFPLMVFNSSNTPLLVVFNSNNSLVLCYFNSRNSPLYWLCSSGHLSEAHYLVQAGWDLQREPWIALEGKSPQQTRLHQHFVALSRSARSLQHCCRDRLRTRLRDLREDREVLSAVQRLPVPAKVKDFLCLRDCHFTDDDLSVDAQRV